jgi:hypothetical protein
MPNLDNIINNLEEIALKAVVLAETNDKVDWNYFPHDYEFYGFRSWMMNGSRSSLDRFPIPVV